MSTLLVFSEQPAAAFELLSTAREIAPELGLELAAAVLGGSDAAISQQAGECAAYGANKVYVARDANLGDFHVEQYADALAQVARSSDSTILLVGSTRRGKELAGRVAQKLGCGAVTDAVGLGVKQGQLTAERYALGGNTIATDAIRTNCQVIAVMPRTFEASRQRAQGEIVHVPVQVSEPQVRVVESKAKPPATANIETADSLVVVGKGLAKQEDLQLARALASAIHAELGCTRALSSDYHWLGEERMIGISGKKCKPRLMISIGVSGQIQHTVGILTSKMIVAINKDKAAPIFKIADYGIVGDLYQVVPKLTERVAKR
jgi:electron transfer flavoprotein alpha subunit